MMNNDCGSIEPVNMGDPAEFTMLTLAQAWLRSTRPFGRIVFRDLPQAGNRHRCPDIRLAKERLAWQPTILLEQGLAKTVEYFEHQFASAGKPRKY